MFRFLLALLLVLSGSRALAQVDTLEQVADSASIMMVDTPPQAWLGMDRYFEGMVDSVGNMKLSDAMNAQGYRPLKSFDFPLPLDHRLWARMKLGNGAAFDQKFYFNTGTSDSVVVHVLRRDSVQVLQTGNFVPPMERDTWLGSKNGLNFTLAPGETVELYVLMKEKVGTGPHLKPAIVDYNEWYASSHPKVEISNYILAVFLGAVLILFIYNLIIFFSTTRYTYLFYALYLLALIISLHFDSLIEQFGILGFSNYQLNRIMVALGLNGISIFYLLFGRSLVEAWRITPGWDKVLKGMVGLRTLFVLVNIIFILSPGLSAISGTLLTFGVIWFGVEGLILLVYIIWLIRSRSRVAWFFIVGSILVFGSGLFPLMLQNIINLDINAPNYLLVSLTLEVLVFSWGLGYKMRQEQNERLKAQEALNQELSKVNTAFGRFVPHEFIESLGYESVLEVSLGDQVEKEVTVLFADIRGYTTLAEEMTPSENFQFLNAYLGRLGPPIQAQGGFVNQYYGDGIMALFLNDPSDALRAAIEMQRELEAYNRERMEKGRIPIQVGIGMHTGSLMMGIIGDTLRMDAGVVSDTVNSAARMEGLTKHFGVQILMSATTQEKIRDKAAFGLRYLGKVLVKGRKRPTGVFECFDGDPAPQRDRKAAIRDEFEQGLKAYLNADFPHALRAWESVLQGLPGDPPTQWYAMLAQQYLTEGTPPDWQGVEVMMMK